MRHGFLSLFMALLTGVTISGAAMSYVPCDREGCCCAEPASMPAIPEAPQAPMGCCCSDGPADTCRIEPANPNPAIVSFLPSVPEPEKRFAKAAANAVETAGDLPLSAVTTVRTAVLTPHHYKTPPLYLRNETFLC
ncbi:MAG: hypothetical protein ACOZBW_02080 [Thermodesulfobacteriota bacterium]